MLAWVRTLIVKPAQSCIEIHSAQRTCPGPGREGSAGDSGSCGGGGCEGPEPYLMGPGLSHSKADGGWWAGALQALWAQLPRLPEGPGGREHGKGAGGQAATAAGERPLQAPRHQNHHGNSDGKTRLRKLLHRAESETTGSVGPCGTPWEGAWARRGLKAVPWLLINSGPGPSKPAVAPLQLRVWGPDPPSTGGWAALEKQRLTGSFPGDSRRPAGACVSSRA